MSRLIDVVNFNADASCLSAEAWLRALEGGDESTICRWLTLYVSSGRRVVLGFTGATVADILEINPQVLDLVNRHPTIFEVVLRPFSHDIALLRTRAGFELNFQLGRRLIERTFANVSNYFLPAEFMLTNSQVGLLSAAGVRGTFVNASRFKNELRDRIPAIPYVVRGTFDAKLRCLPVLGSLNDAYLTALHLWDVLPWNQALTAGHDENHAVECSWRDGESFLLVPDGVSREEAWLRNEAASVERVFLSQVDDQLEFSNLSTADSSVFRSYPVHSFADWIKEFRLLGYLQRLMTLERQMDRFDNVAKALWLGAINSDVFSAVEKNSPVIPLRTAPSSTRDGREITWTIRRSERGCEGEEFLELLEIYFAEGAPLEDPGATSAPHMKKLWARAKAIDGLASA